MKRMKILRAVLCAFGVLFILNAVVLLFVSNFNLGILLELMMGALLLGAGCFFDKLRRKVPLWVTTAVFLCIAAVLIFGVVIVSVGATDTVDREEDAIIVLGCGIRGERLSVGLKSRLDCALECYNENPDALIVVSGGQGPQEDITEALAMERYLLAKGVPGVNIIKEEKATSTYENFLFSKQLLDERLGEEYAIAYVTNEYHIYRAGYIAGQVGFTDVNHAHSTTLWYTLVSNTMREMLAVAKAWVSGK